jgi:hypothetical protein
MGYSFHKFERIVRAIGSLYPRTQLLFPGIFSDATLRASENAPGWGLKCNGYGLFPHGKRCRFGRHPIPPWSAMHSRQITSPQPTAQNASGFQHRSHDSSDGRDVSPGYFSQCR